MFDNAFPTLSYYNEPLISYVYDTTKKVAKKVLDTQNHIHDSNRRRLYLHLLFHNTIFPHFPRILMTYKYTHILNKIYFI